MSRLSSPPPAISLRELTPADARVARELWNRSAEHDFLSERLFAEKVLDDHGVRDGDRLVAELDGSLAGMIVAVMRPSPGGARGYIKLQATRPDLRRRGIGAALLAAAEERLRTVGAVDLRVAESAPNYLTPGVDERYESALRFYRGRGFNVLGGTVNLTVDLLRLQEQLLKNECIAPAGWEIRRAALPDRPALVSLLAEHWPSWDAEALAALEMCPSSVFLAVRAGRPLGFAAYDSNNIGVGWFGPMGTAPQARGQGVGSVLLLRTLLDMAHLGYRRATIPWVGPVEFYQRVAEARAERRFVRLEKPLTDPPQAKP